MSNVADWKATVERIDSVSFDIAEQYYRMIPPAPDETIETLQHPAILVVFSRDGDARMVPLVMESLAAKDMVARIIAKVLESPEVETVCFISEAWMVKRDLPPAENGVIDMRNVTPSQAPDRIEVLACAYTSCTGAMASSHHFIERSPGARPTLRRGELMFEAEGEGKGLMGGRFFGNMQQRTRTQH